MSAKIIVEKLSFVKHPEVLLDIERLCDHVNVDSDKVILRPKPGSLIPALVCLTKAKIEYSIKYEVLESETVIPEIKK
jgi:hypothetical protein